MLVLSNLFAYVSSLLLFLHLRLCSPILCPFSFISSGSSLNVHSMFIFLSISNTAFVAIAYLILSIFASSVSLTLPRYQLHFVSFRVILFKPIL
ncbi:hypothetical protein EDC96DRAFT_529237 [Choanephora cucurbitarum]|nr:hypothetical protein EDC96DRAFT_529237 [Choanephora cucurbitarum]